MSNRTNLCRTHRPRWRTAFVGALALLLAPSCRAADAGPLPELLERAGRRVQEFVEQFSDVKCIEQVSQMKLEKNGKVGHKEDAVFDYLALLQTANGDLTVDESRLALKEARQANLPLLVTNGFSTLLLIFHPAYQANFQFEPLEDEVLEGKLYKKVGFQHLRGTPSPAVLLLRGREYPLELSGTAWLDPASGVIVRITATIESGMDDLGMQSFRSDVHYAPVAFSGLTQPYWLPASAVIDVVTPRQHWRNIHRFSDYKRFSVATESTIGNQP